MNLEIVMNPQLQTVASPPARFPAARTMRAFLVSFFGLLPFGVASGLMLMQILGVWGY